MRWEDAQLKFSFVEVYYNLWIKLVEHYGLFCEGIRSQHGAKPTSHEWVGLYENAEYIMP